jgi:cysteinyl-tRNA synthetase
MPIQITNTLTNKVEPFETIAPTTVKMYVCGPTVYDNAHIGHAMSALVFDMIRRYLEYRGYTVQHVQNFTDVDDKIINRANAEGRDPLVVAEEYIAAWHRHVRDLNLLPATVYPRATATIPQMIRLITTLIERGHAYEAGGDVYFRVRTDPAYGKLSHRSIDSLRTGARIASDAGTLGVKNDPLDFALWKTAKPGEPAWESPWGPGRPGWHIECSAMIREELGTQIDIHGGGNDLIFPHHENEIAQSESATGAELARYWVHNGMVQLRSPVGAPEKMSKSTGNLVTIDDFLQDHPADVLRLLVLASPYRAPLVYDEGVVADNERKLERLLRALRPATGTVTHGPDVQQLEATIATAHRTFEAAMDNDFNSAGATAALFEIVKALNTARDAGVGGAPFERAQMTFREIAGVLGLTLEAPQRGGEATPFIELLIQTRAELRTAQQFALADLIRDQLAALGVVIEDTPRSTTWRWT